MDKLVKEIKQIHAYAIQHQSYGASPKIISKLKRNQERLQEIKTFNLFNLSTVERLKSLKLLSQN